MLINNLQIEVNLRRTASKRLISLLNKQQLEWLAFKHFGVRDDEDNIIGYQCPYSGKIYTDYKDIVLEHIIPVNSNGGTVLFNCIPTSKEVNGSDQKGAKHLITWWINSKFWNQEAPKRLEKLVNYMLEAYDIVFEEYTVEEIESSYLEINLDDDIIIEDVEFNERDESKTLNKQAKENGINSYLGFITNCIDTLEKYNINTSKIKEKLKELENKHIFEDIERYQSFQNIIEKIIISKIGDDNRSYLTYILNINIRKLMDSIDYTKPEEIYNEINLRLTSIENILKLNKSSIIDYFKNLRDIFEIDIIYKDIKKITQQEIDIFIENIKVGIDTKINIFIDMLNQGNSNILKQGNTETLEGYPDIKLAQFWNRHQSKIKQILFEELKDNPKYDTARKIIDNFTMANSVGKQISIFIDMLNKGNNIILKTGNKETLEGYPNIKLAQFWSNHQIKIKQKLFVELKDDSKYDTARKIIDNFTISNSVGKQISIFIDMLNKGNSNILKVGNNEILEGYPNIKLHYFWSNHQSRIKQKLFVELKDNSKYDTARKLIEINEITINVDKQITIFIDMLNKGNSNILKFGNNETLERYPNIKLNRFWNRYQSRIKQKLFVELKDNCKYDTARKLIEINEITINVDKQIPIFIDMLNQGNSNILKVKNNEILEGYPNIKLSNFWSNHQSRIKQKLFVELKDNSQYNTARQTVLTYFKVSTYEELEEKQTKKQQLKELKQIKKDLENAEQILDSKQADNQRKRA